MTTIRTKQIKLDEVASYDSHPTFSSDTQLVDKKYVDDSESGSSWTIDGTNIIPTGNENIELPIDKAHKILSDGEVDVGDTVNMSYGTAAFTPTRPTTVESLSVTGTGATSQTRLNSTYTIGDGDSTHSYIVGGPCNDGVNLKFTNHPNAAASNSNNAIWTNGFFCVVAHGDAGISYGNRMSNLSTNKTVADGLGNNTATSVWGYVLSDSVGLAVGTLGGLTIRPSTSSTFTNYTTSNGLPSNSVLGVFMLDDSHIYGCTNLGFTFTTDAGANWTNKTTSDGLGHNYCNGVYVVSTNIIGVATNGGFSISLDSGATFTNKTTSQGLGSNTVKCVYGVAGTFTTWYVGTDAGLSISTDDGASFTNYTTSDGLPANNITGVTVMNGYIYVATSSGVAISSTSTIAFTAHTDIGQLGSYYATGISSGNGRVAVSTSDGYSTDNQHMIDFTPYDSSAPTADINNICEYVTGAAGKLYGATNSGVIIRNSYTSAWITKTTSDGLGGNVVRWVAVRQSDGTVFAATNGGISFSTNGGATWTNKSTSDGLVSNDVYHVLAVENSTVVLICTSNGFSRSADDCSTFANKTTSDGLPSNTCYRVFNDDKDNNDGATKWIATSNGAAKSSDSACTAFTGIFTGNSIFEIVTDYSTNILVITVTGNLYYGAQAGTGSLTALSATGGVPTVGGSNIFHGLCLYHGIAYTICGPYLLLIDLSTSAANWVCVPVSSYAGNFEQGYTTLSAYNNTLYMCNSNNKYYTTATIPQFLGYDGCFNKFLGQSAMTETYYDGTCVYAFSASTSGNNKIVKSTNNGKSFAPTAAVQHTGGILDLHSYEGDYVLIGHSPTSSTTGGVEVSTDGGATWAVYTTVSGGLPSNTVNSVFILNKNRFYIGTAAGFCISTDQGANWTTIGIAEGLTSLTILSVWAVDNYAYACDGAVLCISSDYGLHFTAHSPAVWGGSPPQNVYVDDDGLIYVTFSSSVHKGFSISSDGGATWSMKVPPILATTQVRKDGDIVYLSAQQGLLYTCDNFVTYNALTVNDFGPLYSNDSADNYIRKVMAKNGYLYLVAGRRAGVVPPHAVSEPALTLTHSGTVASEYKYDTTDDRIKILRNYPYGSSSYATGLDIDRETGAIKTTQISASYTSPLVGSGTNVTALTWGNTVEETGIDNIFSHELDDVNGDTFTIVKTGIYAIEMLIVPTSCSDATNYTYITRNGSATLGVPVTDALANATNTLSVTGTGSTTVVERTNVFIGILTAADVIRTHTVVTNVFDYTVASLNSLKITFLGEL